MRGKGNDFMSFIFHEGPPVSEKIYGFKLMTLFYDIFSGITIKIVHFLIIKERKGRKLSLADRKYCKKQTEKSEEILLSGKRGNAILNHNQKKGGTKMEKLRISDNRRYFVKADGTPFVWLADTAWTLPQRMKWDDLEYYLQKRKSQGFTVLQICALDPERDEQMKNPAGEKALLDDNLETPNERYFAYLDWILDRAEQYGFYVLLLPVWGQLVVGDNWMGQTFPKTVTEKNARTYGRWLGNRYKDKNHILWCLGGDRQPIHRGVDYKPVWRNMAEGLAEGLTGERLKYNERAECWEKLLITYHACHEAETGECSTMSYWDDKEAWISFIMLQSGHGTMPKNYNLVAKEYGRERRMPVWDGEPAYEMMPTSWPVPEAFHDAWMVRKRAYWSLLAGAFGYTYGHGSMWCTISERERDVMAKYTWYDALQSEGSRQMKYLRAFMEDLEMGTAIPCQQVLTKQAERKEDLLELHVQAAVHRDGKFLCAYFPSGGSEILDLSGFAGNQKELYLWWWNPADGQFYSTEGEMTEHPAKVLAEKPYLKAEAPASGKRKDWILLIYKQETGKPIEEKTYYDFEEHTEVKKVFAW